MAVRGERGTVAVRTAKPVIHRVPSRTDPASLRPNIGRDFIEGYVSLTARTICHAANPSTSRPTAIVR